MPKYHIQLKASTCQCFKLIAIGRQQFYLHSPIMKQNPSLEDFVLENKMKKTSHNNKIYLFLKGSFAAEH